MPISKGNYHQQFVVKYDKDNMLRLMFKYECFNNEILDFNEGSDKSIQQYFLFDDKTNQWVEYVGGIKLLLKYHYDIDRRVGRPSMRTLLGLK